MARAGTRLVILYLFGITFRDGLLVRATHDERKKTVVVLVLLRTTLSDVCGLLVFRLVMDARDVGDCGDGFHSGAGRQWM